MENRSDNRALRGALRSFLQEIGGKKTKRSALGAWRKPRDSRIIKGSTFADCGAMVQRLARGPFKVFQDNADGGHLRWFFNELALM